MSYQHSAFQKYRPHASAIFKTMLFTILFFCMAMHISFNVFPATGWYKDAPFSTDLEWIFTYLRNNQLKTIYSIGWLKYLGSPHIFLNQLTADLNHAGLYTPVKMRVIIVFSGTLVSSIYIYISILRSTPLRDNLIHVEGRKPITNQAAKIFTSQERKISKIKQGSLNLAPHAQFSSMSEPQHTIAIGASGAGKTTLMKFWLAQLLQKQQPILIHDSKGDFTSELPTSKFVLLAPHDER